MYTCNSVTIKIIPYRLDRIEIPIKTCEYTKIDYTHGYFLKMSLSIRITGASYSRDATSATKNAIIALPKNAVNWKRVKDRLSPAPTISHHFNLR